jgi:hypothetical protein
VDDVYNLIVEHNFNFIADGVLVHSFSYCRRLLTVLWRIGLFSKLPARNDLATALR